jgi:bacteriocin leader peptide (microcyclamide/patellamide family)
MYKKNLMPIAAGPVNPTTTEELPGQLTEVSEEALQQIIGGLVRDLLDDGYMVTPENGNLRRRR